MILFSMKKKKTFATLKERKFDDIYIGKLFDSDVLNHY